MSRFPLLVAATALLALAPLAAVAGEARASGNVPVRSGPGEGFDVIGHLVDHQRYEILRCTLESRFCLVAKGDDVLGWARGSYLVGSAAKAEATPYVFAQPDISRFPTR